MITIGLIFLGERLDLWDGLDFGRLWPLVPMAIGLGRMLLPDEESRRSNGRLDGLWLVFVGGIFLMHNFHVMSIGQSWPLFMVAAGVAILFGSRRNQRNAPSEGKL